MYWNAHTFLQCSMHPAKKGSRRKMYQATFTIRTLYVFVRKIIRKTCNTFNTSKTYFFLHKKKVPPIPFLLPLLLLNFDLPAEDEHDHLVLFSNFFCWLLVVDDDDNDHLSKILVFLQQKKNWMCEPRRSPASKRERERRTKRGIVICNVKAR